MRGIILFSFVLLVCSYTSETCPSIRDGSPTSLVFSPYIKKLTQALNPSSADDQLQLIYFNRQETEDNAAYRYIFKLTYNKGKTYYVALLSVSPLGSEEIENHQIVRFMQSSDSMDAVKFLGVWNFKEDEVLPCPDLKTQFWRSWSGRNETRTQAPTTQASAPSLTQISNKIQLSPPTPTPTLSPIPAQTLAPAQTETSIRTRPLTPITTPSVSTQSQTQPSSQVTSQTQFASQNRPTNQITLPQNVGQVEQTSVQPQVSTTETLLAMLRSRISGALPSSASQVSTPISSQVSSQPIIQQNGFRVPQNSVQIQPLSQNPVQIQSLSSVNSLQQSQLQQLQQLMSYRQAQGGQNFGQLSSVPIYVN